MRKNAFYYLFMFLLVCTISLLAVGCPNESAHGNDENTSQNDFGFKIQLPSVSRAVTYYSQDDASYYKVFAALNGTNVSSAQGNPGATVTLRVEKEGDYTIKVEAFNSENTLIADGESQQSITADDGFVSVTVHLTPKVASTGTDISVDIVWDDPTTTTTIPASQIDFTDYSSSDYSIKVKNNTMKRLVAFKGTPDESTLISGIPANATNWGLKYKADLFGQGSSDFVLFIITEDDYLAHKSDLRDLEYYPFAKIYAFYSANTDNKNNNIYNISQCMGGACSIVMNNTYSNYNIELRKDGINGDPIGYVPAYTAQTTFKVDSGIYYIFPVYRKYSSVLNEIITQYPKTSTTGDAFMMAFELNDQEPNYTLNSSSWQNTEIAPSSAYIRILNNTNIGINLYESVTGNALLSTDGNNIINSGKSKFFRVDMELVSGTTTINPKYANYKSSATYSIGNPVTDKIYLTSNSTTIGTSFDYYAGKMYTINVFDDENQDLRVDTSWMDSSTDVEF